MSDFCTERIVKSLKRRRCCCTGAWIEAKEPHVYYAGQTDGDFWTARIHLAVHPIYERRNRESWESQRWEDGLLFEDFLEDILKREDHPQRADDIAVIAALPGVWEWFPRRASDEPNNR